VPEAGAGSQGASQGVTRPASRSHSSSASSSGWLSSSDSISHGRFAPGSILDGRYRIIGLLGRGGMGEVYRADDLRLGQPVALKFLPDTVAADPVRLAQFHNEVRTARQVSHPNICRVYDIGEIDGHLFLSMELVDGEDLATSLRRIGRFPEDKATDIARQLCAGLAAAHDRGVVHRDLKPANVMLDGAGKVRIMDFGLAAAGAVDDVRVGTPAYMAPEQLLGREVTARSDIYALGLALYELFTGRRAFRVTTLNDLVEQHQSGQVTPPSDIVSALDPAIERTILRCLDRDPARRPSSALAVSAGLPGGDPLAAALAAGETPSPQMVAAAGEGEGLRLRLALPVFVAVLAGIALSYAMAQASNPLQEMDLEYTADVLVQKARDATREIGYPDRPVDEAYGFYWDTSQIEHHGAGQQRRPWREIVKQRPAPLVFWYRRSQEPMVGVMFHHDLLTPGLVTTDDPPPTLSGMIQVTLDSRGFLTAFEAIPAQVQEAPAQPAEVEWNTLFRLAGVERSSLQAASPQWQWLAGADTRAAWTGSWADSGQPLRVEAAALHGRPVGFQAIGPWTRPSRTPSVDDGGNLLLAANFVVVLFVIAGSLVLLRKNLREGRGDYAGALRFAVTITVALWALWVCQVHLPASPGTVGAFLVALVTTSFYGLLFWALYLALEPFVRRHWPRTLVSWTTLLGGRVRDPIVGRDVLFGVALGVAIALLVRSTVLQGNDVSWPPTELLLGGRAIAGSIVMQLVYAVRGAMLFFFLIFLLRVVLRNQWAAALAFVALWTVLDALDSDAPLVEGTTTALYSAMLAFAVLRWGLTTLTVGVFVANLLLNAPAPTDLTAWYAGGTMLLGAIPVALAAWGFYSSVTPRGGQT
jgi:serine/threonine-protein kinase